MYMCISEVVKLEMTPFNICDAFLGRLWVVPRRNAKETPQQLRFRDYKPEAEERLSQLIKRVNNNLEEDPLAGKLILG